MFTECPYCGFLVALDDQGQPLPRCPNCAQRLRDAPGDPTAPPGDASIAPPPSGDAPPGLHPSGDAPTPPGARTASGEGDVAAPAPDATTADEGAPDHAAAAASATPRRAPDDAAAAPAAGRGATPAEGSGPSQPPRAEPPAASVQAPAGPVPWQADAVPAPVASETDVPVAHSADTDAPQVRTAQAPVASSDDARPPASADAPGAGTTTAIDAAAAGEHAPGEAAAVEPDPATHPARADTAQDDAAGLPRTARSAPSFARTARRAPAISRRRRWLEALAVAGLLLVLCVQLLLADRARLAGDARWRPLLSTLCGTLGCALPAWREPSAFRVVERDVRAQSPGVLRVSARIRNGARWAQPWPALQVTLLDANGRAMATRIFQPREYLGGAPAQPGLGSGQEAALSMQVVEPGPQAVAFTFDFR